MFVMKCEVQLILNYLLLPRLLQIYNQTIIITKSHQRFKNSIYDY